MREVVGVEADAEKVCGDEAELRGVNADEANDDAIERGHDPAVPHASPDQNGGNDGENAGNVVQSKHRFQWFHE